MLIVRFGLWCPPFDSLEQARVQRRGAKPATFPFADYFSYAAALQGRAHDR
jgi:hypothetical protein